MNDEHLNILVLSLVIFSTLSFGSVGVNAVGNWFKKNQRRK